MIVIPGKIPISIHPFFWLLAGLIGWFNSGNSILGTLIWIGIIFVSVLIHEYGHALTAILFQQKASIQLVAMGGLTSYEGPKLKFWQQFIIVFNGPLFGFGLFLLGALCLSFDWSNWPVWKEILYITTYANLFWTVVNLLPVLPLDGGQLLRIALEGFFGVSGYKASLLIGAAFATLTALGCFLVQQLLPGAFFFLFAYQSFDLWLKSRKVTAKDRSDDLRQELQNGEEAYSAGKKDEAGKIFHAIRNKTSKGLLYNTATQYLAFLEMQKHNSKEAYELLLEVDILAEESKCLLLSLSALYKNWKMVAKLSTECYQIAPSLEIALNNARAFAYLRQPKLAGGWLHTAWQRDQLNLESILSEEGFQAIRNDPDFQHFIQLML